MAAEVSSLFSVMDSIYDTKSNKEAKVVATETKRSDLVTMDLLGGGCGRPESEELGLEIKKLVFSSGAVFSDRSRSENGNPPNFTPTPAVDLFRSPPPTAPNLELKLFSSSSPSGYQSVCTLDKVKFALERIKNPKPNSSSHSPSSSSTSSSIRQQQERKRCRIDDDEEEEEENESVSVPSSTKEVEDVDGKTELQATGCPGCLSYVLVARVNPKCPRCTCRVPLPVMKKAAKIDLNSSITTTTTFSSSSPAASAHSESRT